MSCDDFALKICKEILSHPKYISSTDGIVGIEETMLQQAVRQMPSKVGAFEEAMVVGVCVSSGWLEDNKDIISGDELKAKEELFRLHNPIIRYVYKSIPRITSRDKRPLEQAVCEGFQQGIACGYKIKNLSVYSQMTTQKLLETFDLLQNETLSTVKILSARTHGSKTPNSRS